MAPESYLTTGEFNRSIDRVVLTLNAGINHLDSKLDDHTTRIASLETKMDSLSTVDKKKARNSASGWSAAVAGVMIGAFEIVKLLVK